MTLDEIWDRIDESNLSEDTETRRAGLQDAITKLKQLISAGDTRAWYPLGYALYCHPDRKEHNSVEASEMVRSLTTAIQYSVEASLSQLYLAFHFFDFQDFQQARHHTALVDENDLHESMAEKLHELVLCITIRTEGVEGSCSAIESCSTYIQELPRLSLPPFNLMNVLEESLKGRAISNELQKALRRLDLSFPILGENGFTRLLGECVD